MLVELSSQPVQQTSYMVRRLLMHQVLMFEILADGTGMILLANLLLERMECGLGGFLGQ